MYKIITFSIFLIFGINGQCQKKINQIEIKPFIRRDSYPEFSYNYAGRVSTDHLKMKGKSWGINLNYKYALKNNINLKGGLGYYNYSFDKLENINTQFGVSDTRPIKYPSLTNLGYYTDGYHYNNILINLGIEKLIYLKKELILITGMELNNYFTFSQVYHISYQGTAAYKNKANRLFGHSLGLNISLVKQIGKMYIGPVLVLPVFDTWKKDNIFQGEVNSEYRNKWINGIGLGISCNFLLKKK